MSVTSSSRAGAGGDALHVVTSFHLKASRDVLEDNVKIALLNARTPGVAATHVLLEGDREELLARIEPALAGQLSHEIARGRLVISVIATRPTYADIFSYSNTVGDAYVVIANSDILFPVETVERIVASGLKPAQACFALTRWNVTPNGIFIQGMTPSPPWPERTVSELRRHEQNFFSYDAYVFRAPIVIPPDTAGVFIGSLGCDTTLAAIFKASGYSVSNPAIALRIAHVDVKPRSYRSPSAIADLDRNVDALVAALRRPEAGLTESVKALFTASDRLVRGRLWFGHGDVGRFGRALQRAIGATAWSDGAAPMPLKTRKVKVDRSEIERQTFDVDAIVADCEAARTFIEWEVTGFRQDEHVLDVLMNSPYRNRAFPIWQYQWQSLRAPEHMSQDDVRLYDDVMAVFRSTLMNQREAGVHVSPLADSEATTLASRMSHLLQQDLEDETLSAPQVDEAPPRILMIDPDALGRQGHYLPYDLQLQNAAAARSIGVSFLMNRKMDPAAIPPGMKTHLLLDSHSWEIASRGIEHPRTDAFVAALEAAIAAEKRAAPGQPLLIYMYCGSFEHARLVQEVMAGFDEVTAVIHLFWLSVDAYKSDDYLNTWAHFAKTVASDPRIRLTVATENIQAVLQKKTGIFFDVAPHPSTTFDDKADVSRWPSRLLEPGETPVVLFPGAMREEKGFLSTVEAVRSLTTTGEPKFQCVVAGRSRADTPKALLDGLASIRNPLVQIEERALDDREFIDFLASGDIIVLPYVAAAFAERPSGILIDAITLGRPLIVTEGTWLAAAVRHYGWGEVVADDGGMAITTAVRKMRARYQQYLDAIRTSREGYIQQHSWGRLIKSIVKGVRTGPRQQPIGLRIVSHERSEHISVDETGVVARLLQDRKGCRHTLIDVGAHIGTSAAFFHDLGWTIHCFEPDPVNREQLVARLGEAPNVVIDPRAVSDKPATSVAFYKSPESTGISALHAFRDTHQEANVVDVTTIADYVDAWGIARIDFLKIDVEGFDFSVLKGVPWDRIKPDVIECEYEDAKTVPLGHAWEDIAKFLRGLGYAVYISEWHAIVRYGIAHDWRRVTPYPGRAIPSESWGNILAFRVDPGYAAVKDAFEASLVRRDAPPKGAVPIVQPPAAPREPALVRPDDLRRFKNAYEGRRCFVMGNGPSLNKMDLSKLEGEVVFGCNSIFLLFDRIKWRPTFYTCVDSRVLPDRAAEIAAMLRENPAMQAFFPTELQDHISKALTPTRDVLPPLPNVAYFRERWNSKDYPPFSMFSVDINEHVIQPFTVAITMLQIAMYMGFSEIYLVGCDTSYTIPPDVKKEGLTERGEIGLGLTSTQDNDPNHFDPSYFGKDRKWHDPQVDKMIDHYGYARQVAELRGKTKIFNATVGGNLEVFQRVDFTTLFTAKSGDRINTTPGRVGNGRDSYIRPVQTPVRPPGPPVPVAADTAAILPSSSRPLTLFPVASTPVPGGPVISREGKAASVATDLIINPVSSKPVIQPAVAGAETARMPSTDELSSAAPAMKQSAAASRSDVGRWIVKQVRTRRMAQIVLAVGVGLIAGAGLLFAMPAQGDMRPMLFAGAGIALLGVCGLYFAYRVVRLAQRLSAENAALQQRLLETSGALERLKKDTYSEHARQSSTLTAIAGRVERSLQGSVQDVGSRISSLDSAIQDDLRKLADAQKRVDQALATLNARATAIDATASSRMAAVENRLEADAEARTQAAGDVDELKARASRVEMDLARVADLAARAASDARLQEIQKLIAAEAMQVSRLADRVAYIDDIAKGASGSLVALAGKLEQHVDTTRDGLAALARDVKAADAATRQELASQMSGIDVRFRVTDERFNAIGRVIQAAESAGAEEIAALDRQIMATGAKAGEDLATIANQLAEVASLSQSLTAEVAGRLAELDYTAADTATRLASSEAIVAGLKAALESAASAGVQEVSALETQVQAVLSGVAEQRAWAQKQFDDLASQAAKSNKAVADLGERMQIADTRSAEARSAVERRLSDLAATSEAAVAALKDALKSETEAGSRDVSALGTQVKDVLAGVAEQRAWAEKRLQDLASQAAETDKFIAGLGTRMQAADVKSAEAVSLTERRLAELAARSDAAIAAQRAWAETRLEDLASQAAEADKSIAGLGTRIQAVDAKSAEAGAVAERRLADLAAKSEAAVADVRTSLQNLLQNVTALDRRMAANDAALVKKAEAAGLADLADKHAALVALIAESENAGEQALGELEDRIGKLHDEATKGLSHLQARVESVAASEAAGTRALNELGARLDGFSAGAERDLAALRSTVEAALAVKADATDVAGAKREIAQLSNLSSEAALEYARMDAKISAAIVDMSLLDGKLGSAERGIEAKLTEVIVEAARWAQKIALLESQQKAFTDALAEAEQAGLQQVTALRSEQTAVSDALLAAEAAGGREVAKIEQSIHAVRATAASDLAKLEASLKALVATKIDPSDLLDIKRGIAALGARADEATLETDRLAGNLEHVAERAQVDNAAAYKPFNRTLQPEHIEVLESAWAPRLSLSISRPNLAYMAARAIEVERNLEGRFAASIEDQLLRTLVARATKGATIDVLEIGTLFGTSTAITFDALKDRFARSHFTLLDPLDAYREDHGVDPVTGRPVNERVVRRNLSRAGMDLDQFRLINRRSTDADAISEASEKLYDVLVIDADHSYAGVKSDFENYARLVRLGGHIVFGGYGLGSSPDVRSYVDAELPSARFVTSLGAAWGTAVFRVVQQPQGAAARRSAPAAKAGTVRVTTKKAGAANRNRR